MSNKALDWALKQRVGSPSAKAILVVMANKADNQNFECWPDIEMLTDETELNRKTVISSIKKLINGGFINDTGKRAGITKSIPIYSVNVSSSSTKIGTTEQYQNRNYIKKEVVPEYTGSSPKNDSEAVPLFPAHIEEPSLNHQEPSLLDARETISKPPQKNIIGVDRMRVPLDPPPEWKSWAKTEKGWKPETVKIVWDEFNSFWKHQIGAKGLRAIEEWETTWKAHCLKQRIPSDYDLKPKIPTNTKHPHANPRFENVETLYPTH